MVSMSMLWSLCVDSCLVCRQNNYISHNANHWVCSHVYNLNIIELTGFIAVKCLTNGEAFNSSPPQVLIRMKS